MKSENSYIDRGYQGTTNGFADTLRSLLPYLDSTTNRCFTIQYVQYPKRPYIYTPYGYKGSTTSG